MREAVRIEIPFAVAIMLANLTLVRSDWTRTDLLASVAVVVFVLLIWGPGSLVQRRPYASAILVGVVLLTVLAAALIDLPDFSSLLLGDYAVIVVGSALLVTLNERAHRLWLLVAMVLLIVALALASVSDTARVQGALIGVAAIATSVAGNSLVQRRRERSWAQETLLRHQRRELRGAVARLEAARVTIATLEGVLPICSHCKRIRDAGDVWVRIEAYVEARSGAQFSHGICPDCMARYYKGIDQLSE